MPRSRVAASPYCMAAIARRTVRARFLAMSFGSMPCRIEAVTSELRCE